MINKILSILSILLGIHYFYSFMFFHTYFSCLNLNYMALINLDDLIYPLGKFNYDIIILTQIGYIITLILFYSYKNKNLIDKYSNMIRAKPIWFKLNYQKNRSYIILIYIIIYI